MSFQAQIAPITLEDIWQKELFTPKEVPGFNFMTDGEHFSRQVGSLIVVYHLASGDAVDTIFNASAYSEQGFTGEFDDYSFSKDERLILLQSETESIYRRSTEAYFFTYDRQSGIMQAVAPGKKIMHCTISPDGRTAAYVLENNIYTQDLGSKLTIPVTTDGKINHVINGSADWVYEEEFKFTKAFQWSPDGAYIAYYKFDESRVREFTMTLYNGDLYPEYETFKYPKVNEANSIVSIHFYHTGEGSTSKAEISSTPDGYIPRINWTEDAGMLCVQRMNRHQNTLSYWLVDAKTGAADLMLEEVNERYIEINDDLTFLADGERFVRTSEMDGYWHIYLHNMDGSLERQLTRGAYDISSYYGVDEKNGHVYFQAAMESPLRRGIYRADLDGSEPEVISAGEGVKSARFSSTHDYFIEKSSTINSPPVYTVRQSDGTYVRMLEENASLVQYQRLHGTVPIEFFDFTTSQGVNLNGWMIKPPIFDTLEQYPVLMYVYGGPGSQRVIDSLRSNDYWWFQMLAQQGYVVACVDNRGTGGRGEDFRKMTYQQLGHYETIDQIESARYLGGLPFIDASRVAIFGWSYGGYMSSLCLLKGNDVFKSAIAVAPVTNWKWYDTIYTERYMRKESENPDGYAENSPINFVDRLKGRYLLVHGMADDNVHCQHSIEMANALITANKQFDTYFYPNRNHGITSDNARLHLYTKMTEFLNETLRGS